MQNGFQQQCSYFLSNNRWSKWIRTASAIAEWNQNETFYNQTKKYFLRAKELYTYFLFTWEHQGRRLNSRIGYGAESYKKTGHFISKYEKGGR